MSDASEFRTLMAALLDDAEQNKYSAALLDEGLKRALEAFSQARPRLEMTTAVVILAGREQEQSQGMEEVLQVFYPPEKTVLNDSDWYFYRPGGRNKIYFRGDWVPDVGDSYQVVYLAHHTIQGMEEASGTTLTPGQEKILVTGAVGFCQLMRADGLNERYGASREMVDALLEQGKQNVELFQSLLEGERAEYLEMRRQIDPAYPASPRGSFASWPPAVWDLPEVHFS